MEIRQRICDLIELDRECNLLVLAQTCRDFYDPAIAGMWQEIHTLEPIVKCIGRDGWEETNDGLLKFSRSLTPSDIATIKKYAALVQCFGPRSLGVTRIAEDVWETLRLAFPDTVIFSNLRVLHIDKQIVEYIALFSIQSLTRIDVSLTDLSTLPPDFPTRCPDITCLGLSLSGTNEVPEQLSHWPKLSRFESSLVTHDLLQALSQHSSSLRHLQFHEFSPKGWPNPPAETDALAFPSLETVEGYFNDNSSVIQFLDRLPCSNLKTLFVNFVSRAKDGRPQGWRQVITRQSQYLEKHLLSQSREEQWQQILQRITRYSGSLKHLQIGDSNVYLTPKSYDVTFTLPGAQIFATLANLTLLNQIKLSNPGGFDITDDDLRKLTEALPLLEGFHLNECFGYPPRDRYDTTIASLAYFAQNCPLLSSLSFGFDAREDKLPQEPMYLARGSKLRFLGVENSPMDHAEPVAHIICTIFYNLEEIVSNYFTYKSWDRIFFPNDKLYLRSWARACKLLEMQKEVYRALSESSQGESDTI